MQPVYPDERKGFFIFLFLVLITASVFAFGLQSSFFFGFLGVCWGGFGFLRLLYLTASDTSTLSQIISLPARLLFGLSKAQQQARYSILKRLEKPDVLFWFGAGVLVMAWLIFNSLYPAELSIVRAFHVKRELLFNMPVSRGADFYNILSGLSFYAMAGVMVFLAITYARNPRMLLWGLYGLLPFFLIGMVLLFIFAPMAGNLLWPGLEFVKGGGLGQAEILQVLTPDIMGRSGSAFLSRFMDGGIVAAYGVYVLFIPVVFLYCRDIWDVERSFFEPATGLLMLLILLALDIFWLATDMTHMLFVLGLPIVALSWGAARRYE